MARAYSLDLRERVVAAVMDGASVRSVASRYGLAPSSVARWSRHYRQTGSFAPGKMGGHRPVLLEPHRDFIIERLKQTSHMTTSRLQRELAARGVIVCQDTVWRFLRRQGLRFKKKPGGQ